MTVTTSAAMRKLLEFMQAYQIRDFGKRISVRYNLNQISWLCKISSKNFRIMSANLRHHKRWKTKMDEVRQIMPQSPRINIFPQLYKCFRKMNNRKILMRLNRMKIVQILKSMNVSNRWRLILGSIHRPLPLKANIKRPRAPHNSIYRLTIIKILRQELKNFRMISQK